MRKTRPNAGFTISILRRFVRFLWVIYRWMRLKCVCGLVVIRLYCGVAGFFVWVANAGVISCFFLVFLFFVNSKSK